MQPICDDFFKEVDETVDPSPEEINRCVRSYLDAVRAYLLGLHDEQPSGRIVNNQHADLTDQLIRKLFRITEERYFRHFPRLDVRFAIVSVGGYGRRELSLASDIDLLFLYQGKVNPYIETMTEAISHRLWDAKLELGIATRTLSDCLRIGKSDLPTMTSYLDARPLIGDSELAAELDRNVRAWIERHRRRFIEGKLREQEERRLRSGESLFLLQPNLRESIGGLRDYQTALWIGRATEWEISKLDDLPPHGFIDANELRTLRTALDFLWRARNELHRSGRKNDQLHFEAQEHLTRYLGFQGTRTLLPIEEFMRSYYLHARVVQHSSARIIDHALGFERQRRRLIRRARREIEGGFVVVDGRIEIPDEELLRSNPLRLLSVFRASQRYGADLSPRAQRMILHQLPLLDQDLRADPGAPRLFLEILSAPNRVYRTLVAMNELGLLSVMLPEFAHLVGLWQHDLYHTYTVDAHSLFLIEQLQRIRKGNFAKELPLATRLIRGLDSTAVLYLSALLHDIGKGRGGQHSPKGAALIPEIGRRLGLSQTDTDQIAFLVLHHLTISNLAEHRDVHDPRLILNVANLCGSRAYLRNLYLLTVADIRSVSPEAWTNWKAGLLEALYRNVADWLETGLDDASAPGFFLERAARKIEATEAAAIEGLANSGISREESRSFLESMPRRYVLNHGPREITDHVRAALAYAETSRTAAISLLQPEHPSDTFSGLAVLAADRPRLLATMAGILASAGHNILGAQAYTNRYGLALETYEVERIHGGPAEAEAERARLEQRLTEALENPERPARAGGLRVRSLPPRILPDRKSRVRISNDESDFYSIIDISATDRPGFLHEVARALADLGIDVVMSRASTRANRVRDSFYVTDSGEKILPARRDEIRDTLLGVIQVLEHRT